MRIDAKLTDIATIWRRLKHTRLGRHQPLGPQRPPAERELEVADGAHGDGVDHLLMELRLSLGWRQPVLSQQIWVFQVHRLVGRAARWIDIDHFKILAHRPGIEPLPWDIHSRGVYEGGSEP